MKYSIALEQQLATLRFAARMLKENASDRKVHALDVWTVEATRRAEPFYIEPSIGQLLEVAGMALPDTRLFESDLFTQAGYAWFERPLKLPQTKEWLEGSDGLEAIIWCATSISGGELYFPPTRKADAVIILACPKVPFPYNKERVDVIPCPMTAMEWPFGQSLQAVLESQRNQGSTNEARAGLELKYFAALMALVSQQLLISNRQRAGRATRRRAAVDHPEMDRLINVIELRRKTARKDEPEERNVEWSHRWLVRGHWRQQWYRSTGRHQPVWIAPYVKGPEDKPLSPVKNRVFAVVR